MKVASQWLEYDGGDALAEFGQENPRSGCVFLRNYTAQYLEWGQGPTLVLLPGLAGGVGLINPLAAALARHFRVISYQLRGEDDCFALRRRFDLSDLVEDLVEFLDGMCLESPILLGVSFGAAIALEFASRHRNRLSALVTQGGDIRFRRGLLRQVAGQVLSHYPLPPNSPFVNQFFSLLFGGRPSSSPIFEFVTRQCWQTDQSVMAHRFKLAEGFDLTSNARRISVPTLLLTGDRDLLVSERGLCELHGVIQGSKLVTLKGAGHLAFITHQTEMVRSISQFAHALLPVTTSAH